MTTTIYHNPKCGTSRKVLGFLREAGIEPKIIEYLKAPPTKTKLKELVKQMGISPRGLIRKKEKLYADLGLDAAGFSDPVLIDAMVEHPILIERPIVATDTAAVLCRPPGRVYEVIGKGEKDDGVKDKGEPKKAATKTGRAAAATYLMRASLDKKIFREFEIPSSKSLYDLAKAIISVFGFDFDHAFGFFSKLTGHIFDSPHVYNVFADMEDFDSDAEGDAQGVTNTKIAEAFPKIGAKMTFLFDYGDEWHFLIEVIGAGEREPKVRYPKLLKSVGKAPKQYPGPDEE
jgi:arsenate reductase (glutaredoxin)